MLVTVTSHKGGGCVGEGEHAGLPKGMSGVYSLRNRINGKCYVGSAVDLRSRYHQHRHHLRQALTRTSSCSMLGASTVRRHSSSSCLR